MTNLSNMNAMNGPGASETPPNPFAPQAELPSIPTVPGFDVQAGRASVVTLHNLLILVVLVISATAIFGLRKIGLSGARTNAGLSSSELDLSGPRLDVAASRALMEDLGASRTTNQVQVEELKKNPFSAAQWFEPAQEPAAAAGEDPGKGREERERAQLEEVMTELKTFNLQSVMGGSRPIARINGEVYGVGDQLGKHFKVTWIEGREVELEADGKAYSLTMGSVKGR